MDSYYLTVGGFQSSFLFVRLIIFQKILRTTANRKEFNEIISYLSVFLEYLKLPSHLSIFPAVLLYSTSWITQADLRPCRV